MWKIVDDIYFTLEVIPLNAYNIETLMDLTYKELCAELNHQK